ncbi:MAG: CPBP family intramembrane glutamic endopeptidase [Bacteroides sp.]
MKTAIKLVIIYFGMQILGLTLVAIPCSLYSFATTGIISDSQQTMMAPSLLLSIIMMAFYLWKRGYISKEKETWSIVSPGYLIQTVVISLSGIWLLDVLGSHLQLPDIMKESFDVMQSGWVGIFSIAIMGPVLEELLFRGAITKALLQHYSPTKAILFSGLIFGVFHVNPAQVIGAGLIGLLLAWIYYKTASLIPCIVLHILNNSLSVYLNIKYPDLENLNQLVGNTHLHLGLTVVAGMLFIGAYFQMKQTARPNWWKKETTKTTTL